MRLLPQLDHAIDEQEEREERARGAKEEYKPCYSSSSLLATRILRKPQQHRPPGLCRRASERRQTESGVIEREPRGLGIE